MKEEVKNDKCECGHARIVHSKTTSINYTQGSCDCCKCQHFIMDSGMSHPIDTKEVEKMIGEILKEISLKIFGDEYSLSVTDYNFIYEKLQLAYTFGRQDERKEVVEDFKNIIMDSSYDNMIISGSTNREFTWNKIEKLLQALKRE